MKALDFILKPPSTQRRLTAVSLYSGAGLSDWGYQAAGFRFVVQLELNEYRAGIGRENFSGSEWIVGDIRKRWKDVITAYRRRTKRPLDLIVATPPCQGMSSSNPSRGKRSSKKATKHEERNSLILAIAPIVKKLRPRLVVAENVRQILTLHIKKRATKKRVVDLLRDKLAGYTVFTGVVDVADYGIPQSRKRAVIVAVRNDEPWLAELLQREKLPWPRGTHGTQSRPHVSLATWLRKAKYESLDAKSSKRAAGSDPLHFVPHYDADRYLQIKCIPKNSGKSAYDNSKCPGCSYSAVPMGRIRCPKCSGLMRNRPYVMVKGKPRLIAGFDSSYRRMRADKPAATITTNSSHVGSDFKIHPFENRVLSALECADLQTVPRNYQWQRPLKDKRTYLIRNVIGEAFPPYFTFLHGCVLSGLLSMNRSQSVARASLSRCERVRGRIS